jgi:hypothetical protein
MVLSEAMMRAVKLVSYVTTFGVGWYCFLEADYSGMKFNQPEERAKRRRRIGTKEDLENQDEHCFIPLQRWYRQKRDQLFLGVDTSQHPQLTSGDNKQQSKSAKKSKSQSSSDER